MNDYYATAEWRATRDRYLLSRLWSGECAACGLRVASPDIHHRTYRRVGHENLNDLVGLCRQCHDWIHSQHALRGGTLWEVTRRVVRARKRRKSPYRAPNVDKSLR